MCGIPPAYKSRTHTLGTKEGATKPKRKNSADDQHHDKDDDDDAHAELDDEKTGRKKKERNKAARHKKRNKMDSAPAESLRSCFRPDLVKQPERTRKIGRICGGAWEA